MKKKFLFFLPLDSPYVRIARRGLAMLVIGGLSLLITYFLQNGGTMISPMWLPIITAIGAMLDKSYRELIVK